MFGSWKGDKRYDKTGYSSAHGNRIYKSLICGYCGKYLGSYEWEDGKEYSDIEGWVYCPYCGEELEPDEQ